MSASEAQLAVDGDCRGGLKAVVADATSWHEANIRKDDAEGSKLLTATGKSRDQRKFMHDRLRVLLVGDFSGVHLFLRKGLEELGLVVDMVNYGSYWSRYNGSQIFVVRFIAGKFAVMARIVKAIRVLLLSRRYNVVQFINPFVFSGKRIGAFITSLLLKKGEKKFLLSCGCDSAFYEAINVRKKLSGDLCARCIKYDLAGGPCSYSLKKMKDFNDEVAKRVDGIIPLIETYRMAYEHLCKTTEVIDFPVFVKSFSKEKGKYGSCGISEKVRIFHAVSVGRSGFKGSEIICKALGKIQREYKDEVEVIISKRSIPFDDYIEFLGSVDILVDQTSGWALGMNALLAMSKGVVVLTCYEDGFVHENVPALKISTSVESIVRQLAFLLENKEQIVERSALGIQYINNHHHYRVQARKFLAAYGVDSQDG